MKNNNIANLKLRAVSLLLMISLLICGTLSFTSCKNNNVPGEEDSESESDTAPSAPKPKIEITIYTDRKTYPYAEYFSEEFTGYYSRYKVNLVLIEDSSSPENKLNIELAAGKGPDLFMISEETSLSLTSLIDSGALADFKSLTAEKDKLSLDRFDPSLLKGGEFGGKQLLLPLFCTIPILTGVEEYITDAKVKLDGSFLDFAKSLENYNGVVFKNFPTLSDIYLNLGFDFIDYVKGECIFDDDKMAEMIQAYLTLYSEIGTDPQKYKAPNGNYMIEENAGALVSEDVLFTNPDAGLGNVCNIDTIDEIDAEIAKKYLTAAIYAFPGSFDDKKISATCGFVIGINAKSDKQDAALTLINDFADFGNNIYWSELGISSDKSYNDCIKQLAYGQKLVLPENIFSDEFKHDMQTSIPRKISDLYYEYLESVDSCNYLDSATRKIIDEIIDSIVGGKSAAEAIDEAEAKINDYIKK